MIGVNLKILEVIYTLFYRIYFAVKTLFQTYLELFCLKVVDNAVILWLARSIIS